MGFLKHPVVEQVGAILRLITLFAGIGICVRAYIFIDEQQEFNQAWLESDNEAIRQQNDALKTLLERVNASNEKLASLSSKAESIHDITITLGNRTQHIIISPGVGPCGGWGDSLGSGTR